MKRKKIIAFDLDGTLTNKGHFKDFFDITPNKMIEIYKNMKPNKKMIALVNRLAEKYLVYIYTARSDIYQDCTVKWLKKMGVNYKFVIMNKCYFDYFVDDKAINMEQVEEWEKNL